MKNTDCKNCQIAKPRDCSQCIAASKKVENDNFYALLIILMLTSTAFIIAVN